MTTLHLGVVDVGYSDKEGSKTTGEVAEHLENKYHIMRAFFELYETQIGDILADQVAGAIESIAQGAPPPRLGKDVFTQLGGRSLAGRSFGGKIEDKFRMFLDAGEMQRLLPPKYQVSEKTLKTSSRRKQKQKQNKDKPSRPAFVDTGLYQASFRAWVD